MLGDTQILTIQEVADRLRVHHSTVSRYAKSGLIKSYVLGSRRLFKESDVDSFFENQVAPEYVSERRNYGYGDDSET